MKMHMSCCFNSLQQVSQSVSRSVLSLVTSLVLTCLDYGSATIAGVSGRLLDRIQSVLNAVSVWQSEVWLHVSIPSWFALAMRLSPIPYQLLPVHLHLPVSQQHRTCELDKRCALGCRQRQSRDDFGHHHHPTSWCCEQDWRQLVTVPSDHSRLSSCLEWPSTNRYQRVIHLHLQEHLKTHVFNQ